MIKRGFDNRGLSTIVAILLMLLLVMVAVGIIWVVVKNVIQSGAEQISLGKYTLDLQIEQVQKVDDSNINVKLKRNAGDGEFVGISFIIDDGDSTEVIKQNISMDELEVKTFQLILSGINASNIKKISIYPIFKLESGKEIVGPMKDEYTVSSSTSSGISTCTPYCPTGAVCGSDGCGGSCGTCSGSTPNCINYQCSANTCTPSCVGKSCGSDGCGGSCGTCLLPNSASSCSASYQCIISSCNTGYANCDSNTTNGCETLLGTITNCASCGNQCSTGQTCTNNVCVTPSTPPTATIINVYASGYEAGTTNIPRNTLDNNLSSRWSSEGIGQWIKYEFNQTVIVNRIQIAFHQGDQRIAYFAVETSLDNSSWTRVLNNMQSSGNTLNLQTFNFANTQARYLRIIGNGNSDNSWNAYSEVKINDFVVSLPASVCTTHTSSNCTNGDVYWWNSCGQIEGIRYDCNSTQTCSAGACVNNPPPSGQLLAFPGAEGFGKYTRGAYAGSSTPRIIIVNTLSGGTSGDEVTGKGSLRWAFTRSYPRIVLFEVSGYINLSGSHITINNPYITVAGQTAPNPGITITGRSFTIDDNEVIIQHLRSRLGIATISEGSFDAFGIYGGNNIYIDHCSFSWAVDENAGISPRAIENLTITNSIISEALYNTPHPDSPNSYGMLIATGDKVFVSKNLFAHLAHRSPMLNANSNNVILTNNLLYNTGTEGNNIYLNINNVPLNCSIVGNTMIPGPGTIIPEMVRVHESLTPGSKIYLEDNEGPGRTSDSWSIVRGTDKTSFRVNTPAVWMSGFTSMPSSAVENYIVNNAGARPADRDDVDERVINEVISGTGKRMDSSDIVWPTLAQNTRLITSIPGYPASNTHGDDDDDGYTNLEEWLYDQARIVEGR